MCMFCAAVPAVAAMGAAAAGEQRKQIQKGTRAHLHARPYGKLTLLAIAGLLILSAISHIQRPG